jgi:hypothetical protein
MAKNTAPSGPTADPTESYLENPPPKLFLWFFYAIVAWGILFSAYYILGGSAAPK